MLTVTRTEIRKEFGPGAGFRRRLPPNQFYLYSGHLPVAKSPPFAELAGIDTEQDAVDKWLADVTTKHKCAIVSYKTHTWGIANQVVVSARLMIDREIVQPPMAEHCRLIRNHLHRQDWGASVHNYRKYISVEPRCWSSNDDQTREVVMKSALITQYCLTAWGMEYNVEVIMMPSTKYYFHPRPSIRLTPRKEQS